MKINPDIVSYIESEIIPRYYNFDAAHQRDHVMMVIKQSLEIAEHLDVDADMVYVIASYHDTGLCEGRERHHEVSARIIKSDENLRKWFDEEQIQTMADAAEDHRASAKHEPRTIYGRIVAEADRFIDPETIVRRTIQYGLDHYPELSKEQQYDRMMQHLHEKYGRNGYLKLWFPESPNTERLEKLRQMLDNEEKIKDIFAKYLQILADRIKISITFAIESI
ncbi:MAG: HD domain-containing protein [Bacteroidales bacterium]|nr:HD domain-containing protein [Bacteroidales bacterium]